MAAIERRRTRVREAVVEFFDGLLSQLGLVSAPGFFECATFSVLGGVPMSLFSLGYAALVTIMIVPSTHANLVGIEADTGNLYEISFSSGPVELTLIKETGILGMASLEFFDGSLYGFTSGLGPTLYELSLEGDILDSRPIDLTFAIEGGLVIAPDGSAFGLNASFSSSPKLFQFDLASGLLLGEPIAIDTGPGGTRDINGLAWLPALDGARNGTAMLLGLDRVESRLITIDPLTGSTTPFASVPNVGGVGGMVVDDHGQIFLSTSGPTGDRPGSNLLYRVDPVTTDLELIGTFGPTVNGIGISGLAVIPEPATISLLALGGLALLCTRRKRRLTAC